MLNIYIATQQLPPDQQATVAVEGVLFRAHEGNAMFLGARNDAIEALPECFRRRHLFIVGDTIAVEFPARRPTAQFLAQKNVRNPIPFQLVSKRFAVELGEIA